MSVSKSMKILNRLGWMSRTPQMQTVRCASCLPEGFKPLGSISAPFTPMKQNGDVDTAKISSYCDHLKRFGVPSTFVLGTTGEGLSLTTSERKEVTEAWMDNKHKFEHQIFHIGAPNIRDSQDLASHAESIGVDAIACISPNYFKPQRVDDLVEYMRQVAASAPNTPFYLYDINFISQVYLDNVRFLELAEKTIPTLVGIKHSSPELNSLTRCHEYNNRRYHIMLGSDDTMLPALSLGIRDSVPSSYIAPLHNSIRDAYDRGEIEKAQELQLKCMEIAAIRGKYASGAGVFAVSRAMMSMLGFDLGPPRLPLVPMETDKYKALEQELKEYGFFDMLP